ncbi:LPXTG cell wall anchor domain-containing protein [Lacticaseibacillus absianus]|uniref:LPXTG cell wall anchor domain-containing protein n=1 Tax=Lacticaseibacillus absianus TaxID=2729623 RepID=UPI0015CD991C|nr:LPXTG cell wall anchor domain-containing protein [Lacticaseibacillus absianus]
MRLKMPLALFTVIAAALMLVAGRPVSAAEQVTTSNGVGIVITNKRPPKEKTALPLSGETSSIGVAAAGIALIGLISGVSRAKGKKG